MTSSGGPTITDHRDGNTGRVYCRYLEPDATRCTAEAMQPDGDIILCAKHAILAQRLLDRSLPEVLDPAIGTHSRRRYIQEREAALAVVYYLRRADLVKIGTTVNLRRRLAEIDHDELLAAEAGGVELERQRHEQFSHLRRRGEWFEAADDLLAHAAALRRAYGAPRITDERDYPPKPGVPRPKEEPRGRAERARPPWDQLRRALTR